METFALGMYVLAGYFGRSIQCPGLENPDMTLGRTIVGKTGPGLMSGVA
jgi:hypothetical protein